MMTGACGINRRERIGQRVPTAVHNGRVGPDAHQLDQMQNLVIALLLAVWGSPLPEVRSDDAA